MKKFEYKVVKGKIEGLMTPKVEVSDILEELNTLGQEGWELVNSFENGFYIVFMLKKEL